MKVYVVITNGEVNGELEGVFATKEQAKEKFEAIKENWREWANLSQCDEWETDTCYEITNFEEDEHLEVKIEEAEVQ